MHGRITFWLLMACLYCGAWGCRTTPPASTDPVAPPVSAQPGNPSDGQNLPGVSLKDFRREQGGKKPTGWEAFEPPNVAKAFMKAIGKGPNEGIANTAYAEGNRLFTAKQYAEAAKQYVIAYKRWPDSALEEDAMFMAGESFFFADQYYRASDTFGDMLKKYPGSKYMERVIPRHFAIARYWEAEADRNHSKMPNFSDKRFPYIDYRGNAISIYESMRLNDPMGPLADDALFATGNAHFLMGQYEDADYNYELLRKEYTSSPHQLPSHLLGLRAKLRNYQGSEYDDRPLRDSEKLIEATLTQFAGEIPEERERLLRTQKAIRSQKAEREWVNAEYYYKRKYFRAARFYYSSLLKDYPESNFAEMAQRRLDETKNYPPMPKNYFTWVGRIFGERRRDER